MVGSKYGQYFTRGPKPGETNPTMLRSIAYLDDERIKGAFHFTFTYIRPENPSRAHGPHTHPYAELLGYFGTNPDDPFDLGAEIELTMGEEREVHTFNQSTLVYIPANFLHCPLRYKKINRPFIFIMTFPAPQLHEKSFRHLVSPEEREKMVFFDR
jgi:hypothetical protein